MINPTTTRTTLNVRKIEQTAIAEIKRGAHARGLTIGQYLYCLVLLHAAVRERAAAGDPGASADLATLGLQTITI